MSIQPSDERDLIAQLLQENLAERKRSRRWGIFFKLLTFAYVTTAVLWVIFQRDFVMDRTHVGVVEINGVIAEEGDTSAGDLLFGLTEALESEKSLGAIIKINSPGGSPVQADQMFNGILELRKSFSGKPVIAVVTDTGASGAYYAAAAAERIYANPASLIGSIGVLMDGFGFVKGMEKLGIERRLLTAGENKGFLDPFSPLSERDSNHATRVLAEVHEQFKEAVRAGRQDKLSEDPVVFSGLVWTGRRARELGLIDGFGSVKQVARSEFQNDELIDYSVKDGILDEISQYIGSAWSRSVATYLRPASLNLR